MIMSGRNESAGSDYRYGFQGQEMDDEIKGEGNSVNYKFRMHDPRVGRFFAVDPLSHTFPYNAPYNFSENNVIAGIELEGAEVKWVTITVGSHPNGDMKIINSDVIIWQNAYVNPEKTHIVFTTEPVKCSWALTHVRYVDEDGNFLGSSNTTEPANYGDFDGSLEGLKASAGYDYSRDSETDGQKMSDDFSFIGNYSNGNPLAALEAFSILRDRDNLAPELAETVADMEVLEAVTPVVFYRGGFSLKPRKGVDYKVDKDGFVNGRGISINTNKWNEFIQKYGGAYELRLKSIPDGLTLKHTGGTHWEIQPTRKMTETEYLNLMKQVEVELVNKVGS